MPRITPPNLLACTTLQQVFRASMDTAKAFAASTRRVKVEIPKSTVPALVSGH
jgi:hypothetical protein